LHAIASCGPHFLDQIGAVKKESDGVGELIAVSVGVQEAGHSMLDDFAAVFGAVAEEGLGPGRARAWLENRESERIVASPAERGEYGRLAVLAGWRTRAKILFDVPPSAFTPPPKVVSSVVELSPRAEPAPCDVGALANITRAAFGQRRKMLRQSLKGLVSGGGMVDPAALLAAADIEPTRRAEEIPVEGFARLARALVELG